MFVVLSNLCKQTCSIKVGRRIECCHPAVYSQSVKQAGKHYILPSVREIENILVLHWVYSLLRALFAFSIDKRHIETEQEGGREGEREKE